mmetsp:Transcript_59251/g.152489  ORF Transcript_59251/g.152489 Transcript_59251/m.152489 type:complete len:268 (-) Transcript_59251:1115-1918(-)
MPEDAAVQALCGGRLRAAVGLAQDRLRDEHQHLHLRLGVPRGPRHGQRLLRRQQRVVEALLVAELCRGGLEGVGLRRLVAGLLVQCRGGAQGALRLTHSAGRPLDLGDQVPGASLRLFVPDAPEQLLGFHSEIHGRLHVREQVALGENLDHEPFLRGLRQALEQLARVAGHILGLVGLILVDVDFDAGVQDEALLVGEARLVAELHRLGQQLLRLLIALVLGAELGQVVTCYRLPPLAPEILADRVQLLGGALSLDGVHRPVLQLRL